MDAWRGHTELSPWGEDSVETLRIRALNPHCRAVCTVKWGIYVTLRWSCVFSYKCVCQMKTEADGVQKIYFWPQSRNYNAFPLPAFAPPFSASQRESLPPPISFFLSFFQSRDFLEREALHCHSYDGMNGQWLPAHMYVCTYVCLFVCVWVTGAGPMTKKKTVNMVCCLFKGWQNIFIELD